jgi:maltose alpha-D-glucosyltransferase/alpha-amylase
MPTSPLWPTWLEHAVFYQIYPQSFSDSNADGIGDLPGIIAKLDYLAHLGVNALWLNPIFDSPFGDAGYDVRNFRKVAARYGTNADARRLFREAHKRGMKVVLDLVAGHTSDEHPWFRAAATGKPHPARNWYIWTGLPAGTPLPETTLAKETVAAPGRRPGSYVPNFFPFQPALNYGYADPQANRPWETTPDHPDCLALRLELQAIMRFWLDQGCDGFRVDMASSLIKRDPQAQALRRLWGGFREWLNRDYPEAVLLSEWSRPKQAIRSGFHVDFLIHFNEPAYAHLIGPFRKLKGRVSEPPVFFESTGRGDIQAFLASYLPQYRATRQRGFIALPTGNHDFARPRHGRSIAELKVMYAMLLTMPGIPLIYYGDEIGMRFLSGLPEKEGSMWRTGCRTPMQWGRTRNLGFSRAAPRHLYLPVDPARDAPTVEEQADDPTSLLNFTRALLQLRRTEMSLHNTAGFAPLHARRHQVPFVFQRGPARAPFIVAINPRRQSCTVTLSVSADCVYVPRLKTGRGRAEHAAGRLTLLLGPVSALILQGVAAGTRPTRGGLQD